MTTASRQTVALQALLVLALFDVTAAFSFATPRCSPPLNCRACAQPPPEGNRALDKIARREFGQTAAAGAAAAGLASVFPAPVVAAAKRDEPVTATDKNMAEVRLNSPDHATRRARAAPTVHPVSDYRSFVLRSEAESVSCQVSARKWMASHKGVKDRDLVVGLNGSLPPSPRNLAICSCLHSYGLVHALIH